MANNAPIKRFAVGNGIRASVWKNESKKNGSWLSVTITRTYRDGEEYKDTTSFRRDDLLFVAKASELAFSWCLRQAEKAKREANQE
ncbi:hypothetical protein [Planctomycetes bacterium TBK1r]|uniref:Uncharacterized protein n=1 Tax=Stieleria magnilauensis TaxID=2527963 RepID=A0ABX5XPP3_9BACT|nr:hypothetical protein TBK1r_27430 [Planctomycetes bacterium TBK1r]